MSSGISPPGFLTFGYFNSKYPNQVSRGYALEISRVFRIFREAFGADSLRVRRILACQHGNPDMARQVIRSLTEGITQFSKFTLESDLNLPLPVGWLAFTATE